MAQNKKEWLDLLKEELKNSPLKTTAVFGFVMMVLEKLVDMDFECPCSPPWSQLMSLVFFIVPPVLSIEIMLAIQGRPWKDTSRYHIISSSIPALTWLFLVFMDGQYFVCLMTGWEGEYVPLDKDVTVLDKWCKPTDRTNDELLMLRSKKDIVYSQSIGSMLMILISVLLGLYIRHDMEPNTQNLTPSQDIEEDQQY